MKFYGQHAIPVDQVLYENYFKNKATGFFIEAGASDGVQDSSCKFFEDRGWTGINLEPVSNVYNNLRANRPKAINIQGGLSEEEGDVPFEVAVKSNSLYGGAIEYHPKLRAEVASAGYKFIQSKIHVQSYDNIISKYNIKKVDLFVLDVEGHELSVIKGMTKILPSVFCIEYTVVGLENLKAALPNYRFDFVSFNNAFFSRRMPNKTEWFGSTGIWEW